MDIKKLNPTLAITMREIEFYQYMLEQLETHKPFWFQKEKLSNYNDKRDELEDKIMMLYSRIEKEVEFDMEIIYK